MSGWLTPYRTPSVVQNLLPQFLWRVRTSQPEIYLTFDDGPVEGPTEFVLETLSVANARATFFCIGDNVRKHPAVFHKLLVGGHSVGNHSFNHLNGWKTSTEAYAKNISLFDELLFESGEAPTSLFRPPYGRITPAQVRRLRRDRTIVMWDVLTRDYDRSLSPETCLYNTLRAVRRGSIIVFHDSFKAEKNLRYVLPRLVSHFSEMGFAFKPLTR